MKNGLDSKYIPYPCKTCDKCSCGNITCSAWREWFFARWVEVTNKLRR